MKEKKPIKKIRGKKRILAKAVSKVMLATNEIEL
jgi:hypothetical protein